jgi:hypothetical protein
MNQMDVLPDDAILEIFDFYVFTGPTYDGIPPDECKVAIEKWQLLVHVCRRWRSLVLGSPRRLNLRLYSTPQTLIRDTLDVWPALPLVVDSGGAVGLSPSEADNIIAALGQSNRICQVDLHLADWELGGVLAAMQVPFPELTDLRVSSVGTLVEPPTIVTIPDSFLGGSAPSLKSFKLCGTLFPGLPKLLISATRLVELRLVNIPHSGYISPKAVVAMISVLSCLRMLSLDLKSHRSRPISDWESRSLPFPKRSILPALDTFHFNGVTEYLEDLVTRIDAPRLYEMRITFFDQIDFNCPLLAQFINLSPTLRFRDEVHLQFVDYVTKVTLVARHKPRDSIIQISCTEPDRQILSVAQVCNPALHPISTVENLYISRRHGRLVDAIENALWLQLLLPFAAVKNLYLSKEFAPGIAAALQELVGDRITEVLPSLQNIFVEELEPSGPFQENIGQFVAARQLSDRPIAISFRGFSTIMIFKLFRR